MTQNGLKRKQEVAGLNRRCEERQKTQVTISASNASSRLPVFAVQPAPLHVEIMASLLKFGGEIEFQNWDGIIFAV